MAVLAPFQPAQRSRSVKASDEVAGRDLLGLTVGDVRSGLTMMTPREMD
jgi:hypothetical protein